MSLWLALGIAGKDEAPAGRCWMLLMRRTRRFVSTAVVTVSPTPIAARAVLASVAATSRREEAAVDPE